jgi:hypothetical protein
VGAEGEPVLAMTIPVSKGHSLGRECNL